VKKPLKILIDISQKVDKIIIIKKDEQIDRE
jgi:hypothetical protein